MAEETMNSVKRVCTVLLAVAVGLVSLEPTPISPSPRTLHVESGELEVLSEILRSAINERNQLMLTGQSDDSTQMSLQRYNANSRSRIAAEYDELRARKKRLAAFGLGYSHIETTFESVDVEVSGDIATAKVTERTEMTYTTGGPPESYRYEQVVEFSRSSTGWVIDAIKPKSPEGIPPSTVVSAEQLSYATRKPTT
ncbi:hypothetical protein [Paenarthrobacter sp. NPDC058040]|uniref:hypothetical protein n=1 Tax=unclassified Paenarthrobacter TaxID=2634190 RepID=UPI0036DEA0F9